MSREKSLFVISKILRTVFNTFTSYENYSLLNRDNLTQPVHMQLSQKQKIFPEFFFFFFFAFFKSILNVQHFEKTMTLIADVFQKLRAPKNVVR